MSYCVPACFTRHCLSDPLLHPSAPRPGVERLLRPHVMRPCIMQQAVRHIKGFLAQTSITPLPCHARASRVCHAKCSAMACRFACLLVKLVTASKTHCSTQALLTQGSNGFCISASCVRASYSRSSDTRLPHAHLHHPSSPPGSSIQSLACKQYCYGMTFCVLAGFHHHHRKDPLLHPSAPRPGVERLLRQRVMLRPIMQQAVRLKASARTPPSPLFPTASTI